MEGVFFWKKKPLIVREKIMNGLYIAHLEINVLLSTYYARFNTRLIYASYCSSQLYDYRHQIPLTTKRKNNYSKSMISNRRNRPRHVYDY